MTLTRKMIALGLATTLTGCGALSGDMNTVTVDGQTVALPASESRGYVAITAECPLAGPASTGRGESFGTAASVVLALGDAVIPTTIDFLFDRAIAAARLRRSSSTAAQSTYRPEETFYKISPGTGEDPERRFGCVVFMRPAPADAPVDADIVAAFDSRLKPNWRTGLNGLFPGALGPDGARTAPIAADGAPELVAEFRVEPIFSFEMSTGEARQTGYRLRLVTLAYGATAAVSEGDGAKDLTFIVSVSGIVVTANGLENQQLYTHPFVLQDVPIGAVYQMEGSVAAGAPLSGEVGPAYSMPTATFEIDGRQYVHAVPLQAVVTVTEREEGGDLERALIDSIAQNREQITKPLDDAARRALIEALGGDAGRDGR